jgi:Recombinase zinc beta ribbon domain/Recombinase
MAETTWVDIHNRIVSNVWIKVCSVTGETQRIFAQEAAYVFVIVPGTIKIRSSFQIEFSTGVLERIDSCPSRGSQLSKSVICIGIGERAREVLGKAHLHTILTNPFYMGNFMWGGRLYRGTHPTFVSPDLYDRAQSVLRSYNKPKYGKQEIAFRGLLACARDNCRITGERKKAKYVYYRCTGHRGKCDTPRFREQEISEKLGEVLKNIHIPDPVLTALQKSLDHDQQHILNEAAIHRTALEQRLSAVRRRMDQGYQDKLDGKIPEEFWERKMSEWSAEEQRIQMAISGLQQSPAERVLSAKRILELANKAYSLYLRQNPAEQAKLLRLVLLNCTIDAVNIYPAYRKPFDLIFQRTRNEEWSGRLDLNPRPPAPKLSRLAGVKPSAAKPGARWRNPERSEGAHDVLTVEKVGRGDWI